MNLEDRPPQTADAVIDAPKWIGQHYSGEGFVTLQCGSITARIGYTALHNILAGMKIDPASLYWTSAFEFVTILEELTEHCRLTTDMAVVQDRVDTYRRKANDVE